MDSQPHSGIFDRRIAGRASARRRLLGAAVVTAGFVVFELTAGLRANSLALIGDALHNVTDTLSLVLALVAVYVERRPATSARSFGYQRAGILAAFVNGMLLVGLTLGMFVEAARRFRHPEPVGSAWMLWTAAAALLLNAAVAIWLRAGSDRDINLRAAFLHQIGDAASSAGVIIAAIAIQLTGAAILDPIVSLLIGGLVLWSAWGVLKESANLLIEGTPRGIDPDDVLRSICTEEGVYGVHHLHIWALGPSTPALSCHVLLGEVSLRAGTEVLGRVAAMLTERYGIAHTTIQIEQACGESGPECDPPGHEH